MSLDNEKMLFQMPIELRWRDLDAFNHVNNANFLTYLEEARIRWFEFDRRALGDRHLRAVARGGADELPAADSVSRHA